MLLVVIPLTAQERLPKSTLDRAAAVARVAVLTPNDFNREAQYSLALAYEEGRLVEAGDPPALPGGGSRSLTDTGVHRGDSQA